MPTSWGQLGDMLITKARIKKVPITGAFELTSRCNLKCKMCYVCHSANDTLSLSNEKTTEEWINLARQAKDSGLLYLLLTGGEVFLRSDFKQIYEELMNMGFCIQIYTNATLITPELAKWLGKTPPSKVGITVYGASSDTYKRITGSSSAFNNAINGARLLLLEGINVDLRTTVIKDNVEDFRRLAEIAENLGVQFKIINYVSPRRDGCYSAFDETRLSPKELAEYEDDVLNYFKSKHLKGIHDLFPDSLSLNNNDSAIVKKESTSTTYDKPFSCTAGSCYFWITSDGKMTPCGLMDNPAAKPFEEGFSKAWDDLKSMCRSIPSCDQCFNCSLREYCMTCPARLKNETGSYDKPASYLCELAQARYESENPNESLT